MAKKTSDEARNWDQATFQGYMVGKLEGIDERLERQDNENGRQWDAISAANKDRVQCRREVDKEVRRIKVMSGVGHGFIVACTAILTWIVSKLKGQG